MIDKIIALLQSRTNVSAIIGTIAGALLFFGVDLHLTDPELQEKILSGITGVAGLLAVLFRTIATKKVGGGTLQ